MYQTTYDQCSECKRLIPTNPMANAYGGPDLYTYINGAKVCWECAEKRKLTLGIVPFPKGIGPV